jgi:hypothetical protein
MDQHEEIRRSENLLRQYRTNLSYLLDRRAKGDSSLATSNEITETNQQIRALKKSLRQMGVDIRDAYGEELEDSVDHHSVAANDLRMLLTAMGFRVEDQTVIDRDHYFLCKTRWGIDICRIIVHYIDEVYSPICISTLSDAVHTYNAVAGFLLTTAPLPDHFKKYIQERSKLRHYTLEDFIEGLADFQPYVSKIIAEYEVSDIARYYVPAKIEIDLENQKSPAVFDIDMYLDDWINDPHRNHITVLGDFGVGKSWFCNHYAYRCATRYHTHPRQSRIPILINLRDYPRIHDVKQMLTDAILNKYGVNLPAGYETFDQLNKAGKILLILDGFDEMEQRISDYRSTKDSFWELSKIIYPTSKVILTCRIAYFRDQNEEKQTLMPVDPPVHLPSGSNTVTLQNRAGMEVVYLQELNIDDIKVLLQKRDPTNWQQIFATIMDVKALRDLARRHVLLAMIITTIAEFDDPQHINLFTLYETYTSKLAQQRWNAATDYVSPQDRSFFMQELAWEMDEQQFLSIPYSQFPERIVTYFKLKDTPEMAAFVERDIRTQSYLSRDKQGNYSFAHTSFVEFFVASKLVRPLQETNPVMADIVSLWKRKPFTLEIQDFVVFALEDTQILWQIIEYTRGKSFAEVGYTGGNAVTILKLLKESLRGRDFRNTILRAADFSNADLSGTNFQDADLCQSKLYLTMYANHRKEGKPLEQHLYSSPLFQDTLLDDVVLVKSTNVTQDFPRTTRDSHRFAGSCFPAETRISLPNGRNISISEVVIGTAILSFDEEQNTLVESTVIEILESEAPEFIVINDVFIVTPRELVFNTRTWVRAITLQEGDQLSTIDGAIDINTIAHFHSQLPVFNLSLIPYHTFFANTVLVHNMPRGIGGKDL